MKERNKNTRESKREERARERILNALLNSLELDLGVFIFILVNFLLVSSSFICSNLHNDLVVDYVNGCLLKV